MPRRGILRITWTTIMTLEQRWIFIAIAEQQRVTQMANAITSGAGHNWMVGAADHSLVALLGASPGASTAAFIAISVLEKCFADELTACAWLPKLRGRAAAKNSRPAVWA
jgi:L-2-hydroxyglutarate oxidase LhgO